MENKVDMVKPRVKKGLWKPEEDLILKTYVETHGEGNWATVSAKSGLKRGGRSCRLRWKNYLRPNIKRGQMSEEEEDLIIRMHKLLGNRWSLIAGRLPGRTDNEVKNYWNTHLNKRSCHLDKRKPIDDSNNQLDGHDVIDRKKNKRLCQLQNSASVREEVDLKKEEKEESTVINTWTQETQATNYYTEPPTFLPATNDATFVFDDDPFITYLDSFLLLESSGFSTAEEIYSQMGMESLML